MTELDKESAAKATEPAFDAAKIFAEMKQSVVGVKHFPPHGKLFPIKGGGGTGFFVTSGDPTICEIASLDHVTNSAESIAVVMQDGKVYKARPEKTDMPHEISVYQVMGVSNPKAKCKPVELDLTPPVADEKLLGIGANRDPTKPEAYEGHSIGVIHRADAETYSRGQLDLGILDGEDLNRDVAAFDFIDAEHGDSGGPLFAANRKVKSLMAAANQFGIGELAVYLQEDLDAIKAEHLAKKLSR